MHLHAISSIAHRPRTCGSQVYLTLLTRVTFFFNMFRQSTWRMGNVHTSMTRNDKVKEGNPNKVKLRC